MNRDSNLLTNLLLLVVLGLLLLGFAIPGPSDTSAPPAPPPAAADPDLDDLVAKVDLLLRRTAVPPPAAAPAAADEDEIVIRIPGKLARDLGVTGAELRRLVLSLEALAKQVEGTRAKANETAAIATLRNCCSAQAQFQATAMADVDNDGTGEFGSFREMSGSGKIRGDPQSRTMNPPVISGAFRNPDDRQGFVSRSGYCYRIYLPDRAGDGVAVDAVGYDRVDPEMAETRWCLYAWPVNSDAGSRTFMVNQTGDVLATEAEEYRGENGPRPGAAYLGGGIDSITGLGAVGRRGQDGHEWKHVN